MDCMNAHLCHNLSVPSQLLNLYQNILQNKLFYANLSYSYPNRTFAGKMNSGILLAKMFSFMSSIVNGITLLFDHLCFISSVVFILA